MRTPNASTNRVVRSLLALTLTWGSIQVLPTVRDASADHGRSAAHRPEKCVNPPHGLTGWWPGDGTPDDIAGGFDAQLKGATSYAPGVVSGAFSLPGDPSYVDVPHDPALSVGTGDFTVDLWVEFDDTSGEQVLIEKWVQAGPPSGWTLTKLDGNVLRLALAEDGGEIDVDSAPLAEFAPGTPVHVAAIRRRSHVTLYVNGESVAEGDSAQNLDTESSLKFGHRGNPSDTPGSTDNRGFFLRGRIDEVEYFVGRALPRVEIDKIYGAGSHGKCKDRYPRGGGHGHP